MCPECFKYPLKTSVTGKIISKRCLRCSSVMNSKSRRTKEKKLYEKICLSCENSFITNIHNQLHCSRSCERQKQIKEMNVKVKKTPKYINTRFVSFC
jgi:hypothetical protein